MKCGAKNFSSKDSFIVAGNTLLLLGLVMCGLRDDSPTNSAASRPALFINELVADNETGIKDPDCGENADWLEIYNAGPVEVDVSGMYLTDDLEEPLKWQIPDGAAIAVGGFILVWSDDPALEECPDLTVYHTNFKLGKDGEEIGLFDTDDNANREIDAIRFGKQEQDISYGRKPDGTNNWQKLDVATPGNSNN